MYLIFSDKYLHGTVCSLLQPRAIPESTGLFVFLLLADILNIIMQEIILLSNGDRTSSAIAAFTVFTLIAVVLFGPLVLAHCIYLGFFKRHFISFISSTLQTFGALFFFYGNNIGSLIDSYRMDVGCDEYCVENVRLTASFSLGISLVIFNFVPPMLKRLLETLRSKAKLAKKEKTVPSWISALDMVTMFIKIDLFYSAIVGMVQAPGFCSTRDIGISTVFFFFCVILGVSAELIYYGYALSSNEKKDKVFTKLVSLSMVVMVVCLPLYLLADNRQPLDCAFGCDTFAANVTINSITCDQAANSAVRLLFTLITFIPLAPIIFVLFFKNHRAMVKNTKLHQRKVINILGNISESLMDEAPVQDTPENEDPSKTV